MNFSRQLSIVLGLSALNTAPSTALNTGGSSEAIEAASASGGESTEAALIAAHSDAAASPEAEAFGCCDICRRRAPREPDRTSTNTALELFADGADSVVEAVRIRVTIDENVAA